MFPRFATFEKRNYLIFTQRMGGRAVEGTGLENRQGLTPLVGSNPTPSATLRLRLRVAGHLSGLTAEGA